MSDDRSVLLINRSDVRRVLAWPALLAATRNALIATANDGDAIATSATQLVLPDGSLHLKAGAMLEPPTMSVKANVRPNAGRASGAILAFDLENMTLDALLASADLTAMRTAAIAAVAAQALLPHRPARLALLGAGPVAQRVYEVFVELNLVSEVVVWSRDIARAQSLIGARLHGPSGWATNRLESALSGAEIVVSCTPSRAPLFQARHLLPHVVVLAMGADTAGKREIPEQVMESAVVYSDVLEDALKVGECSYLSAEARSRVRNIGAIIDPSRSVPASATGWTVFDSVGSSAVDVAAVSLVVQQAKMLGLGYRVALNG